MKIALVLEYDGTQFSGWQLQPGLRTVQGELQKALSQIAAEAIQTHCAGRTDAGVHAKHQVVHFETNVERPMRAWVLGCNHFLPKDISVRYACSVPAEFHARHSARSRSYEYWIDNQSSRPALLRHQATWIPRPLDHRLMHEAAQSLLGEHDFSAFRASECQAAHAIRTLTQIDIQRKDHFIVLTLSANAFLHHMVRNIVGVLLPIGFAQKPASWASEVLAGKTRALAGVTAPPNGLYLCDVRYDDLYAEINVEFRSTRHGPAQSDLSKGNTSPIQAQEAEVMQDA